MKLVALLCVWGGLASNFAGCASSAPKASAVGTDPGVVWSDEFNGTSLDSSKWAMVTKAGAIVYYTSRPQNVSVSAGNLNLTALNDNYPDPSGVTHPYTSGYIWTNGIQTWDHGTFEIRAKLSAGQGMHPTFWFSNSSDNFSMIEAEGHDVTNVYANQNNMGGAHYYFPPGSDYTTFHVYRMEWDTSIQPATFKNYVDGNLYSTQQHTTTGAYYLNLNLAAVTYTGGIDSTTPFPNALTIDYVRVSQ